MVCEGIKDIDLVRREFENNTAIDYAVARAEICQLALQEARAGHTAVWFRVHSTPWLSGLTPRNAPGVMCRLRKETGFKLTLLTSSGLELWVEGWGHLKMSFPIIWTPSQLTKTESYRGHVYRKVVATSPYKVYFGTVDQNPGGV
jgi:hypothetical protein